MFMYCAIDYLCVAYVVCFIAWDHGNLSCYAIGCYEHVCIMSAYSTAPKHRDLKHNKTASRETEVLLARATSF